MKKWYLALSLFLSASLVQADGRDPMTHLFSQSMGDFTEELELAVDEGKTGVMVFFVMDECPFCDRMKKTILNQPDLQDYMKKHFLMYQVDIEGDIEIVNFKGEMMKEKEFAEKEHRVRATPVTAFFDLDGNRIVRYTGPVRTQEEFKQLADFAISGAYKEMSYNRYKRTQRSK